MDLAAFDGDLASAFLAERGSLLPDDERETLESWVRQPRLLWEAVDVEDHRYIALRDVGSDESVVITTTSEITFSVGDLVYARVGTIGDRHRFVGVGLDVDAADRPAVEALIAAKSNAWDIARWFGS
jgi:hypothetical protein